jgi:hypothetical protein
MRPHGRTGRHHLRRAGAGALPGGAGSRRAAARAGAGQHHRAAGRARGWPGRLRAACAARRLAQALARPAPGCACRPLHPRAGRPRQVDADGPFLRRDRRPGQAQDPFRWVHARGARGPEGPAAPRHDGRAAGGPRRSPDRACLAAVLRRVPAPEHRRRDDPRPPVRGPVRARPRHGRDLQLRPRTALRRRPEPGPLRAVHRAAARAGRGGRARRPHRLPARATARPRHLFTNRSARRPTPGWRRLSPR